jgi:hypothetical protein
MQMHRQINLASENTDGWIFSLRAVYHYIKKTNGARTHTRNLTHAQHNPDGWMDVTKQLNSVCQAVIVSH